MSRAPLDTSGGPPTSGAELSIARQLVARSAVVKRLAAYVTADVGRPRQLSLEGLFVALALNALRPHHVAHLVGAARVLNALTEEQRKSLGVARWDPDESYSRVERLFARVSEILEAGEAGVDAEWFMNQLARAAVPRDLLSSRSVAVDGTDVETWGALRGATHTVELDGPAAETQLRDESDGSPAPVKRSVKGAKVFGIGPDGRKRYTKDPDARAGHRSATNQRNAGPYVGYELHLAVQTRDVRWTNYVDRTTLGPEVAGVITTCTLTPAGSHRGGAVVDALISAKRSGAHDVAEVVWDPGYSLCLPETTAYPLAEAGIDQTMQLVTHQRGIRPFAGNALLLDGQLFSPFVPAELRDLPFPPRVAIGNYRASYEEKFNQRARWRMVRHAAPDRDGVTRWRCPFCGGLLRSRAFAKTMRRTRNAPLVTVPEGTRSCCGGTLSAPPAELPLAQRIPFGTTAWRISYFRRMVVESANAALKGSFTNLARGFFRVFGLVKISILLGFTLAAYNLDRVRSFRAKLAEEAVDRRTPAKRRLGTWRELRRETALSSEDEGSVDATGPPD
jgi:hypothetical protein